MQWSAAWKACPFTGQTCGSGSVGVAGWWGAWEAAEKDRQAMLKKRTMELYISAISEDDKFLSEQWTGCKT